MFPTATLPIVNQADIQYWDDVLSSEIDQIQSLMDAIPSMVDDDEKADSLMEVERKLKGANGTKKSLKMETRLVTDIKQRRQYEQRLLRLDEDLSHLNADLQALKQDIERDKLFRGRDGDDDSAEFDEADGQKAGDNMLGEAHRIQDMTQDSLQVTKQLVAESKEVGMSTLEELRRQRETLTRIDQQIDRVDGALGTAEKLVKHFSKRMASDRFIQCFAMINVLLLVGVILYTVLKGGSLTIGRGKGAPENPLGTSTSPPVRMLRGLLLPDEY